MPRWTASENCRRKHSRSKTRSWRLDAISYEAAVASGKFGVMKDASPDPALRNAANEAVKAPFLLVVGVDYRDDVYQALKTFAATKPRLEGEQSRLVSETCGDYRRAGLDLPPGSRQRIET